MTSVKPAVAVNTLSSNTSAPRPSPDSNSPDTYFMQLALQEARRAASFGEVPVGAVLVASGVVLAKTHNRTYSDTDPAGHAELLALRRGAVLQQSPRLSGCTLYVTLEPCCMCIGAMIHARIERLVYAADEPKTGAVRSAFELAGSDRHNHQFDITAGVLADESAQLMRNFFEARRHEQRTRKEALKRDDR